MKHLKHERRKSFRKWALTGQKVATSTMSELNLRRSLLEAKDKDSGNVGKPMGVREPMPHAQMRGGMIAYGPKTILSRRANRFRKKDPRPHYNNLRVNTTSIDGHSRYGGNGSGALVRLWPHRPWRGKSERREVIRARREGS